MAIADIEDYELPVPEQLPQSKLKWQVDPRRAALLIHDMQEYFVAPFSRQSLPMREVLRNIVELKAACAKEGIPVYYTAQPGGMSREQRGLLLDLWGPGMTVSPAHRQILAELSPTASDTVLTKWRYSAFHKSQLKSLLDGGGRDQLIITGVYAHVGCLMTAVDAFSQDIQPFIVSDGVADFSREEHDLCLSYAASNCAVVTPASSVLRPLQMSVAG
ncbi:isochorismatase family protein [Arthrobacter sp. ISL-48]|uniref:isochorismatase family protein n=1 Tax=Arthrobacter sp. ISL-48 TaxID=2819110 RepID=UPI001BE73316|nr:isochorismatase family protein [Arthrobacter sp. ISL-48]MBT2533912.1 isochorismatase family protein [Arthrobacter sp. ISL-48]